MNSNDASPRPLRRLPGGGLTGNPEWPLQESGVRPVPPPQVRARAGARLGFGLLSSADLPLAAPTWELRRKGALYESSTRIFSSRAPGAQNFLDLVSNTNTHATRTRTGAHEAIRVLGPRRAGENSECAVRVRSRVRSRTTGPPQACARVIP